MGSESGNDRVYQVLAFMDRSFGTFKNMLGGWIFGLPFAIFKMIIGTVTTVVFLNELQLILFTSSLIQNLTFAEVFMTCHSITAGNQGYLRPGL